MAKKIFAGSRPGIEALPASAPPSQVKDILNNVLKESKVKNARLEYGGGDEATGIFATVTLHITGAEPEKIGAIWNMKKLYVKAGNPVGGPANVFRNQKTNQLVVQDSAGQFVQSSVVRDISDKDRKALNKKKGITAAKPKAKGFPPIKHVTGKDKASSPFISTSKEAEDTNIRAAQTKEQREKGEPGTPFYDPAHGRVRINLFHISSKNIST